MTQQPSVILTWLSLTEPKRICAVTMVPADHVMLFCKNLKWELDKSPATRGVLATTPRGKISTLLRLAPQPGRVRASSTWRTGHKRRILPGFVGFALGGPVRIATSRARGQESSTRCTRVRKTMTQQPSVILTWLSLTEPKRICAVTMDPADHVMLFCKNLKWELDKSPETRGVLALTPRGQHSTLLRLAPQLGRVRASSTWLSGKKTHRILPGFVGFALGGPMRIATCRALGKTRSSCSSVRTMMTQRLSAILT